MSPNHQHVTWQHTEDGLALRIGERVETLPEDVAELLLDETIGALSDDPADDLLGIEAKLRRRVSHLAGQADRAQNAIVRQRTLIAALDDELARSPRGRARRTSLSAREHASGLLHSFIAEHTATLDSLRHWHGQITELRQFVIDTAPPAGLSPAVDSLSWPGLRLAAAATGWSRAPQRPDYVTVFPSESAFIVGDPRRTVTTSWAGVVLDAEDHGHGWRRDGDDDPDDGRDDLVGPWEIGYLTSTGEIYALRRCGYLDDEVWLLGDGFADVAGTRCLLAALEARKFEPNSLLLVVETVHRAQRGALDTAQDSAARQRPEPAPNGYPWPWHPSARPPTSASTTGPCGGAA